MKLVEQELWQREEKGLIGILPVRDATETTSVGPVLSPGDYDLILFVGIDYGVCIAGLMVHTNGNEIYCHSRCRD